MTATAAEAFDMPMREAVQYLAGKVNMPTRRWTDIAGPGHARAFAVAGVQADDLLAGIKAELMKAVEGGQTLAQFRAGLEPMMARLGWRERGRAYEAWRTRLVYQANLNSAYAAGRYAQMTDPDTVEALPFWVYRHSRKRDFRPEHRSWDGRVLEATDAWWRTHYPPNGWGCGCWAEPISRRDLRRLGKDGPDAAPTDGTRPWTDPATGAQRQVPVGIDPGWDHNHGEGWLRGVVPTELREDLRPLAQPAARQVPASLPPLPPPRLMAAPDLPTGLPPERYTTAFLEALGATAETPAIFRDVTGTRLVISPEMFRQADGTPARMPRRLLHRLLSLAETIRDPDEVWVQWVRLPNGQVALRRNYVRHAPRGSGLAIFSWLARGWQAVELMQADAQAAEAERSGALLYRRSAP